MESEFNAFCWAYVLEQERIKYGVDPYERLAMYAGYHNWDTGFVDEIKAELLTMAK